MLEEMKQRIRKAVLNCANESLQWCNNRCFTMAHKSELVQCVEDSSLSIQSDKVHGINI